MSAVMLSQWMKERRSPYVLMLFIVLSVLAVLLFGSSNGGSLKVDVFSDAGMPEEQASLLVARLNESEAFVFRMLEEEEVRKNVQEGRSAAAVRLMADDFRILASVNDYNVQLLESQVASVYKEELQIRSAMEAAGSPSGFREDVLRYLENPPLTMELASPDGGSVESYNMGLQLTFAFALFVVMFTIGFKINAINAEKTSGIWDRMVLSPLSKTAMYMGHLTYSTIIGFIQVVLVLAILRFGFGFAIGDRYGELLAVSLLYVVSVVAMAILFTGITRTPEKFNMVYPSIIPVIPLISGAYMPPGVFDNAILQAFAQLFPLSHAMDAMLGISMHDFGWTELYLPIAKLLLVTVLFMGIGINLVERNR
ncbi:hypothetical protein PAT3040_02822 [Paenibacillus agaridevorans]|uniref:ABC-2 type transporter transmembrane domain-containing protein n=1 Tax=Paenibacillus agaridevorans TaxID=171404 RepID=A0A2R5ENJ7_9BACL|nr:ABC transporter permease [Paenibacillus agaridevorans]GBG08250.1 hypothetical protein PAT3040_02822 [Paenibacillus agaridevorans]